MRPGGRSHSASSSQNLTALCGVSSLGLMTIVLPVTSAGAALRAIRKNGKFQGRMPPITPMGWRNRRDSLASAVALDDLAFDPAGPLGHVIEVVGGEGHLDASQAEHLALLLGDDAGEGFDVLANFRGHRAEAVGTLNSGPLGPVPLSRLGSGQGGVEICSSALRHGADELPAGQGWSPLPAGCCWMEQIFR